MIRLIRALIALYRLEALERRGYSFALASSWCAAPGSGWWVVWRRREGEPIAAARPVVALGLAEALRVAVETTT